MSNYNKITALYSRLSVGDEDRDGGESNSIQNQKIFLENYAKGQHLTNIRHYIDDDESGRFFDRSAYSRMIEDVESGKIGVCIMKDLTRWGRDYLQVGNAMEIFRRNNVRFIAVNNGIDSENPDTLEFAPFINIMSEWYGGRLPYHVRVLWDEAANTGQVPGLEKIVAVIRSREISLTLFYQAMSQCKALYKDHSETIMGNMDSIVFLGGREASTLKDISENWLGKATISMQTEGRSRGQSESYSQNMQRLGRELMTTSEITTMPGDKCILQLRGLPPFLSPKYDLKKHPNYKYTAEFDKKKNAFRLESLFRHRPLRLKPEDEYTVYEVDGSDTDEEADLLNFDDLDSDEFV